MQLSSLFSRAWQQKYLTPAERAIYKFAVTTLLFIPNSAILGGVALVLNRLHGSLPDWLWLILAAVIQVALTGLAKYVSAQGDTQVSSIIQQVQAATATAMVDPTPIVLPPPAPVVPPRASAGPPESPPPVPYH